MAETSILNICCYHCGSINSLEESKMREVEGCRACGNVLFELDHKQKNIRITTRFRETYRELIRTFMDFRKVARLVTKDSSSGSDRSVESGLLNQIQEMRSLLGVIENENGVADNETAQSCRDMASLLSHYLNRMETVLKAMEPVLPNGEIFSDMREEERNANAFLRMFDQYIGETVFR